MLLSLCTNKYDSCLLLPQCVCLLFRCLHSSVSNSVFMSFMKLLVCRKISQTEEQPVFTSNAGTLTNGGVVIASDGTIVESYGDTS